MSSTKSIALIIIILVASGIGYAIGYLPLSNENTSLLEDIANKNAQNENILQDYEALQQDYEISSSEIENLNARITSHLKELEDQNRVNELLSIENDDLQSEYSELQEDYEDLSQSYNAKSQQYSTLLTIYNDLEDSYQETQSSYEDLLNDYELLVAALPLSPVPISAETIDLEFNWWHGGYLWSLSLSIPQSMIEYYQSMDRAPTEDYSVYVTHPYDDVYINTIIQKFNFIAIERSYTEIEKINLIISFVQSLPYTSDSVTTSFDEYPRYPLETLVDEGGDCEDTSILAAALLDALNYDVILVAPPGHMAVGVNIDTYGTYWQYEGENYYFLETTSEGWEIGVLPDNYIGVSAYVYPLNPIPVITHHWTGTQRGSILTLNIEIENVGTAMAEDISAYAAFDSEGDYVWNQEESNQFDLNIGAKLSIQLVLDVPSNKYTRIMVGVLDSEGYLIDVSYSEWFNT